MLVSTAVAQPPVETSCVFAGQTVPCTVEMDASGTRQITLTPIEKADWAFLERDMARDATALHAAFLNDPTWDNAQRYVLSHIYRQYRAMQAMKLATYVRAKIMEQMRAKYGELDELGLIEAVVIEAGMPVIAVPELHEALPPGALRTRSPLGAAGGK
jgi:hypothetical protein